MFLPVSTSYTKRDDGMKTSPLFRNVEAAFRKGTDYLFSRKVASARPDNLKAVEIEMKTPSMPVCFRRVEDAIRKGKDQSFNPRVLSVGPHHHGNKDLKAVEDLKVQIFEEFWTEGMAADVPKFIKEKVFCWYPVDIQKRYQFPIKKKKRCQFDLKYFVDMCIKDACFVLYIIDACANRKSSTLLGKTTFELAITDLLLLENQLPWPLLDKMNTIKFGEQKGKENVIKFLYAAMNRRLSDSVPEVPKNLFDNALHLVGLLRGLCLMGYSPPGKYPFLAYSAEELEKKGVMIAGTRPKENEGFLVGGVVFSLLTATLVIPFLSIHDASRFKNLFLNMIAYECTPGFSNNGEITTFIHVNAALLRDSSSVTIAREKFISTKYDSETIVNLFKEMSTDSFPDDAIYANAKRPRFGVVCKLKVWGRELYEACFNSPYKLLCVLGVAIAVYLQRVESVVLEGKGHQ